MEKFLIHVLTLQGKILVFTVSEYKITEGNFVEFTDERTNKNKKFHASRCEINKKYGDKNVFY